MIHLEDEYRTLEELKDDGDWPPDGIATKGLIPYIKRIRKNVDVLEFGTGLGLTAIHLVENCDNISKISTIDPYKPYKNNLGTFDQSHLDRVKDVAQKNLASYPKIQVGNRFVLPTDFRFDVLLIDADMTYETTLGLLNAYTPILNEKGLIAVTNAKDESVARAIKEFRRNQKHSSEIHVVHNGLWFWFAPGKALEAPLVVRNRFDPASNAHIQSYAQLTQDKWVLHETHDFPSKFFVEFGATDGITGSNSYALEKLGWKGMLAEPNPVWHEALGANRPNCIISHKAIWNKTDKVNLVCPEAGDLATIESYKDNDYHAQTRKDSKVVTVDTISLNDWLEENNAPNEIGYISIDTEGSEYDIISSFNFDKYKVKCFSIEHNFVEPMRSKIYDFMTSKGYKRVYEEYSRWDDWYVL